MTLTLSCAFATSMATPEHVAIAESLGYERAWLYDSPALYPDVWVTLARAAERTDRIGLGPGVLVPSLRHPMTNAAAIATLVEIAGPGRVAVAVGTGFTGRFTLGQRPLKWADVVEYVRVLRALLGGETATWEGAKVRMIQPEGYGAARPIEVPILLGAAGPKGFAAAREVGDGVFVAGAACVPGFSWEARLLYGTILEKGERDSSPRVMEAAGHGAAVFYHFVAENRLPIEIVPQGKEWAAAYDEVPEDERHLALHDRHLIALNDRDRPFVTPELMRMTGAVFTPAELQEQLARFEASGATEIAYQPAGPDIQRELEAFANAAQT
jgi:5,10-methylenetetrahydromethanopterin reductase